MTPEMREQFQNMRNQMQSGDTAAMRRFREMRERNGGQQGTRQPGQQGTRQPGQQGTRQQGQQTQQTEQTTITR
jgi:hypothetical protein